MPHPELMTTTNLMEMPSISRRMTGRVLASLPPPPPPLYTSLINPPLLPQWSLENSCIRIRQHQKRPSTNQTYIHPSPLYPMWYDMGGSRKY